MKFSVLLFLLLPSLFILGLCDKGGGASSDAEVFRKLFTQKRTEQLMAVKQLLSLDAEKQSSLLRTMMGKMREVLQRSRRLLESSGFSGVREGSDDAFPADENTRTALAHVMENTCFLGDVLLRFPDVVRPMVTSQDDGEWRALFNWCLSFVEMSGLSDAATDRLLHLVAQEAGLREKDPDYVNPYAKEGQKRRKRFEDPPPKKKKERKKLQRGPKMSRTEL